MDLKDLLIDDKCDVCIDEAEEDSISTMHTPAESNIESNHKDDSLKVDHSSTTKIPQAPQHRAWESLEYFKI